MKKESFITFLFFVILLSFSSFLFLNKLGKTPLKSWDEAWYAEISRNIVKDNKWWLMTWNNGPYYDHPPLGFWLEAISFKIFGFNEFSARFPSAVCGVASVILIYFIGKILFNDTVGFCAGIGLAATPWFWLRSREGNLDIVLTFLLLLTIYLSIKIKNNTKFIPIIFGSIALLFLTKTVIGIGVLPLVFFNLYFIKQKVKPITWVLSVVLFLIIFTPWYLINYLHYGLLFIDRNIFITGLRMATYKAFGSKIGNIGFYPSYNLNNLHMGILLWYKPFLVSCFGVVVFIKNRSFQTIFLLLTTYLLLFFTSNKTELWHFILIYPAVLLLICAFIFEMSKKTLFFLNKFIHIKSIFIVFLPSLLTFSFTVFTGSRIIRGLYKDIVKNQPIKDEVVLSQEAGKLSGITYIDDDYWPAAIFYSGKNIININFSDNTEMRNIDGVFKNSPKPFSILTKKWILDRDNINQKDYQIIKQIGERVLIKSL